MRIFKPTNAMHSCRKIACLFDRQNLTKTRWFSSYVGDIRKKIMIQRNPNFNTLQKAMFLVLLKGKGEVLISRNLEKKTGIDLSRICYNELKTIGANVEEAILLSVENDKPLFALGLPSEFVEHDILVKNNTNRMFMPLRKTLFHLYENSQIALASKCYALLDWNGKFKFCSYCGNALETDPTRTQKTCCACKKTLYPPVNPVGITLVRNLQQDKVLLVRQHNHPPKMFTCIAGFIEPGESIEENIRREVAEEVGLEVNDIKYVESQYWALPGSSLMIGCFATATNDKFSIESLELESANWFDATQVKNALESVIVKKDKVLDTSQEIWVPPQGSVAHSLIRTWVKMQN